MPEYLSPGVYVEEVDTGAKPIEGVSTSTAGMVGMTQRGPTEGLPELVTSFSDFRRKFGGYLSEKLNDHRYLAYAVQGFFQNGGQRVYIKRVLGKNTISKPFQKASKMVRGGMITRLAADTIFDTDTDGDGTNDATATVKLESLRGISVGTNLTFTQIIDGVKTEEPPVGTALYVSAYDSSRNTVTLTSSDPVRPYLTNRYDKRHTYVTIDTGIAVPANTIEFQAKDEGSWGNHISIQIKHVSKGNTTAASPVNPDTPAVGLATIELNSINNFYEGAIVEIDNGTDRSYYSITAINGRVITISPSAAVTMVPTGARISTFEFSLVISYGDEQEAFEFLNMNNNTDDYFEDVINEKSKLISVTDQSSGDAPPFNQPSAEDGLNILLVDGDDGDEPDPDAYVGVDNGPGDRSGIEAFKDIDQVSILAAPGIASQVVQKALINQCELLKDRFAILDPENTKQTLDEIQGQRQRYDTKYAAIYYPRIMVRDPLTKTNIAVPPSGHIAGIYARTDIERGVHKAPANEVLRSIMGLEQIINKGEQDILNPRPNHINVLRDFRKSGRGYRVWGARCITSDPDWKYINVRRLFIFIEESIEEGTQWVVFEPNDEPTWARVRRSVRNFLTNVWRDGALQGKLEEAFFVRCDRTTMTQTDIDNGKLIMLIGIAPVKPAEFVIFRIGQWAGGSEVEEV